jgi:hypothetical protein
VSGTDQQPPGAERSPAFEALLTAMPHGSLTKEQVHGTACIWCAVELTDGTATDLWAWPDPAAAASSWSPRGCRGCTEPRVTAFTTYQVWLGHCEDCCASCIGAVPCVAADALRARLLDALSRMGQPAVNCARCCQPIETSAERFQPLIWEGMSSPVYGYRHTLDCTDDVGQRGDDDS